MNCPECNEKARSLPGGNLGATHNTRYYHCSGCEIKFKAVGPVVQIIPDEPEASFKSSREAARVLRQAVADDRLWFGEVSDETRELARQVLPVLLKRIKGPAPRRTGLNFRRVGPMGPRKVQQVTR